MSLYRSEKIQKIMKFKKKENIDFEVDWILSQMNRAPKAIERKINHYEKKINSYITLKLKNGQTHIYVNGKRFIQCIRLILNIPIHNVQLYDEIDSIDEAANLYSRHEYLNRFARDFMLGRVANSSQAITPEQEFWGHCSNIQAWVEHNYDTRILMSNISFPLLRELAKAGDPTAIKVFKEEIALRLESGYPSVVQYLLNQGYIKFFTPAEFKTVIESTELIKGLSSHPTMLSYFLRSSSTKFPTILKNILLQILKLPEGKNVILSSLKISKTLRMRLTRPYLRSNPKYLFTLKNALEKLFREADENIGEDILDLIQEITNSLERHENDLPYLSETSRLEAIKKMNLDERVLGNLGDVRESFIAKKLLGEIHRSQSKCSYCGKIIQQGQDTCDWCGHKKDDDEGGFFPYPFIFKPPGGGGGSMKEAELVSVKIEAQV